MSHRYSVFTLLNIKCMQPIKYAEVFRWQGIFLDVESIEH